jgi:hypothetical protein
MLRRTAHLEISRAYHTVAGDAISLAIQRVAAGESTFARLWPIDGVHPGDEGYALFAEAAWSAFREGVERKVVCSAPEKMVHAPTYLTHARVALSTLGPLPAGWRTGSANRVSAYYDMLMSRWLESEVICSNRAESMDENGRKRKTPQLPARLKVRFHGSMVMTFGEGTPLSARFHAYVDGRLAEHAVGKTMSTEFDTGRVARPSNGNTHSVELIAEGLDPETEHTLEIEPLWPADDKEAEIRVESICVAGGTRPGVTLAP